MNLQQKPTLVHVIAWTTLASGIVNLFWGLGLSGTALATVIGFFCIPITILPTVLGIFEIIYAAKLFSDPPQVIQPSTNIAVLEIVCVLAANFFSMAVGILSLIFYNDTIVKNYFASLNGTLSNGPVAVPPSASISTPQPEVVPLAEAEEKPISEEPTPGEGEERPAQ
ncbi:MAG TPA: hypothetical protein VFR47_28965 [Anaerolineales bacterium]|nr:hypothetical protein [Anaerolineales bacterium]